MKYVQRLAEIYSNSEYKINSIEFNITALLIYYFSEEEHNELNKIQIGYFHGNSDIETYTKHYDNTLRIYSEVLK